MSEIIQAMFADADIQLYDLQGNPLNPKGDTEETDNADEATPAEDAKN